MGRHCIRNTLAKAHTFDTLHTYTAHGKDNEKEQWNKERKTKKTTKQENKKKRDFHEAP